MTSTLARPFAAALFLAAAAVHADDAPAVAPAAAGATATQAAGPQALRVVRDKETGRLRAPTPQEMAELMAAERAARVARGEPAEGRPAPLVVKRSSSGMLSAVLGPDYLVTVQGERQPDGRVQQSHSRAADEHVQPGRPAPTE